MGIFLKFIASLAAAFIPVIGPIMTIVGIIWCIIDIIDKVRFW